MKPECKGLIYAKTSLMLPFTGFMQILMFLNVGFCIFIDFVSNHHVLLELHPTIFCFNQIRPGYQCSLPNLL